MYSQRLFREILLRVTGIVLLAVTSLTAVIFQRAVILGLLGLLAALLLIGRLVHRLNLSNRRIMLFFDAIENGESTLIFPEINLSREQIMLNRTFNRINRLLAETKRRSRQQEHFYKALLEQVPGGVIAWDAAGRIRLVNRPALKLLGIGSLNHREQLEQIGSDFPARVQEAENKGNALVKINCGWQQKQLFLSADRIKAGDDFLTLLSLQDIGESLNYKEAEAWGRLTHVLTHEIMNSTAPIVSLSRTLKSYFESDGRPRTTGELTDAIIGKTLRGLNVVETQSAHLIRFTDSYRKLSFSKTPDIRSYSLTAQLVQLEALMRPEFRAAGIAFIRQMPPGEVRIRGDESLLFQVFHNLLKNAVQALENTCRPEIRFKVRRSDSFYLEIEDNGPGIPAEIQDDIFVPFFTTKENGTGIGLSLSRQIVRHHRGQLYVRSEPGKGCCFLIVLPV